MNNSGHVRQLKNILLFEAEKEKEIRSDIGDKISRNSLKKHEYCGAEHMDGDGELL